MVDFYFPTGPLRQFVHSIVYSEYNPDHAIDRLIPDGSINLIIELGDEPQFIYDNQDLTQKRLHKKAWVSGIQTNYISISSANKGMCVVRFHAAGAYPILKLPMSEISNKVIDADLIFGHEIDMLREQLMSIKDVRKKFEAVDNWMLGRIDTFSIPEKIVEYAVAQTVFGPQDASIENMMVRSGYSHKHFIKLFRKYVGISPKSFHRITRFNRVLSLIEGNNEINWSDVSHTCGFYDQAHFIKEFKAFSGLNPARFLKERGEYINYIPIQS